MTLNNNTAINANNDGSQMNLPDNWKKAGGKVYHTALTVDFLLLLGSFCIVLFFIFIGLRCRNKISFVIGGRNASLAYANLIDTSYSRDRSDRSNITNNVEGAVEQAGLLSYSRDRSDRSNITNNVEGAVEQAGLLSPLPTYSEATAAMAIAAPATTCSESNQQDELPSYADYMAQISNIAPNPAPANTEECSTMIDNSSLAQLSHCHSTSLPS